MLSADVDMLMSTDNETGKLSTKEIKFSRAQSGIIFKEDKTVSCISIYNYCLLPKYW